MGLTGNEHVYNGEVRDADGRIIVVTKDGATIGGGGGGASGQADKSAFVEGTGTVVPVSGVVNDTISADPAEDTTAALRLTAKRGLHINMRNVGGTEVGTAAAPIRTDPTGSTTQPVSGSVSVSNFPATQPVSGSVSVSNFPATQPVSGTVAVSGNVTTTDAADLVDNAGFTDGTSKVDPAGFILDEVAGTALTENDVAAARIDSKRAQIGVIEDATTRGQRAAVSAAGRLAVDPSGVTSPVSGTVTANQGTSSNNNWQVQGAAASGATVAGNPVLAGLRANQNEPTAVTDGQAVTAWADQKGRPVVVNNFPANPASTTHGPNTVTSVVNTESTVVTGVASNSIHVTSIAVSNTSATLTRVDFRDGTAGTIRFSMAAAANGGGFVHKFDPPWKLTAAANLTVQPSVAVTDVRVNVHYFIEP